MMTSRCLALDEAEARIWRVRFALALIVTLAREMKGE